MFLMGLLMEKPGDFVDDWYVCVTRIHWVLVKVSPILAKDFNTCNDKVNWEEGAYL